MRARYKQELEKQKQMKELRPYYLVLKWMKNNLTNRQQSILQFIILHLEGGYQLSAKELAAWFNVSTSTIYRELRVFREKNILIKNKDGSEDLTFDKVLPEVTGII